MFSFFYTANYSDKIEEFETTQSKALSALQLHAHVFVLADKYFVNTLLALCAEKYKSRLQSLCDPIEFIESIPDVYTLPPGSNRLIKDIVIRFARIKITEYLKDDSARTAFKTITQSVPEFVSDLLDLFIESPMLGDCENCGPNISIMALQARCRRCRCGMVAIR